jgi:hypothetical protein
MLIQMQTTSVSTTIADSGITLLPADVGGLRVASRNSFGRRAH